MSGCIAKATKAYGATILTEKVRVVDEIEGIKGGRGYLGGMRLGAVSGCIAKAAKAYEATILTEKVGINCSI